MKTNLNYELSFGEFLSIVKCFENCIEDEYKEAIGRKVLPLTIEDKNYISYNTKYKLEEIKDMRYIAYFYDPKNTDNRISDLCINFIKLNDDKKQGEVYICKRVFRSDSNIIYCIIPKPNDNEPDVFIIRIYKILKKLYTIFFEDLIATDLAILTIGLSYNIESLDILGNSYKYLNFTLNDISSIEEDINQIHYLLSSGKNADVFKKIKSYLEKMNALR